MCSWQGHVVKALRLMMAVCTLSEAIAPLGQLVRVSIWTLVLITSTHTHCTQSCFMSVVYVRVYGCCGCKMSGC
jgi:hypothetical protein